MSCLLSRRSSRLALEGRGPHHSRRSSAFSLAEAMIVLAIMAVLSAIAIPRFANAIQTSAVDLAARRLAADLRLAQAQAIKTVTQKSVTFDTAANTYTLVGMTLPDHPSKTYTVKIGERPYEGAKITSVDFSGTTLTFDRFGGPVTAGTVVISLQGRQKTVRVGAGAGRVTIE